MSLLLKREDRFIARYFAPLAAPEALKLRDDAALISVPSGHDLVVTSDMLVSNKHFFIQDPPQKIAQKALRVNVSDLAAKGAEPYGYFLSLALPQALKSDADWLTAFSAGLKADQKFYGIQLMGGDTVTGTELVISICAYGLTPTGKMARRSGASIDDQVYVTGTIGDSALGLLARQATLEGQGVLSAAQSDIVDWLDPSSRQYFENRYLRPEPRAQCAVAIREFASASMDVSDGLIMDAQTLASASQVAIYIHACDVPVHSAIRAYLSQKPDLLLHLLSGGDDYEILCAVPKKNARAFEQAMQDLEVPVSRIGYVSKGEGARFLDKMGEVLSFDQFGFDHFA